LGLLDGVKVIDAAMLFAGPLVATLMGDHGADVIKVEHPRGDDVRRWGGSKNGASLFWKILSRNKRVIAVDLNQPKGQDVLRRLASTADVLIENFRPGRMEKWGLGWETLHALNPRLVMVRTTGFGQEGPYKGYAGFGTLAESMSGFAHVTGEPSGPPTLPPFGLADGIAGIAGAFAAVSALYKRNHTGKGELIDLALYEPLMFILGAHLIEYDQLGTIQQRTGNQSARNSPRNIYPTKEGKWIALSASADSIAKRVFDAIGRSDMVGDPRFATPQARIAHRDEVDRIVGEWSRRHTQAEAMEALRASDAAVAPIYDARDILSDPHFIGRGSVTTLDDPDLGKIRMQGVFPRVPGDPATIRRTPPERIGADTDAVLCEAGYTSDDVAALRAAKAIA